MAAKKSTKSANPEVVPAVDENAAAVTVTDPQEQEASPGETVEESKEQDIFADDILSNEIHMQPEEEQEIPVENVKAGAEEHHAGKLQQKFFRITCRNKVTEMIGGVKFVDGVGYTDDAYAASWFTNKNGYKVDSIS